MGVHGSEQDTHKGDALTVSQTVVQNVRTGCPFRRCSTPQIYYYPRARAHSSLLACYRATEGLGVVLPKRLCGLNVPVLQQSVSNEAPLEMRLTQRLYHTSQLALVSDSTVSMVDAILRYLRLSQGTLVFVSGLLMHPHFYLLELFEEWKLRVVGYDVDFVTMRVDEKDLRKKAQMHGLTVNNKRKNKDGGIQCSALVLLMGVGGRFLVNAENIVQLVRSEFRAVTVELHPVTVTSLRLGGGLLGRADVHITCMDAAGEFGGAVAFSTNPLLAHGIRKHLEERPLPIAQRKRMALMRHMAHLIVSDGMSFNLMLQTVRWGCRLTQTERTEGHCIAAYADRVFEFLMSLQVDDMRSGSRGNEKKKADGGGGNDGKGSNLGVMSSANNARRVFSKPYRGLLVWMINAITSMQQRFENDCISLWEFLSSLDHNVEVVSGGEPETPQRCVASHSDSLLLRVQSPEIAAQILRTAGFDAVPAVTYMWDSSSTKGPDRKELQSTLRKIVILPDCPRCAELAEHVLFLPLYTNIKWKNRQKLQNTMRLASASSFIGSPSEDFRRHVMNTPFRHAYRSKEVYTLIDLWKQRCTNVKTFFADPQPILLWVLLGPVPGYLLSKL